MLPVGVLVWAKCSALGSGRCGHPSVLPVHGPWRSVLGRWALHSAGLKPESDTHHPRPEPAHCPAVPATSRSEHTAARALLSRRSVAHRPKPSRAHSAMTKTNNQKPTTVRRALYVGFTAP